MIEQTSKKLVMYPTNKTKKYLYEQKNAKLGLQLFTRKSQTRGSVGIYCHISVNRKRTKQPFATGIKIPKCHWDNTKQQISAEGYELEKNELSRMVQSIHYIFLEQLHKELPHDAETIKKLYKVPHEYTDTTIRGIIYQHLKKYENNLRYSLGTLRKVKNYTNKVIEFFKNKECITLEESDLDNFYVWLTGRYNNSHNTAVRCIEFLRAALETGHKLGHLPFVPCHQYQTKRKRTDKKMYLSKEELTILENAHFLNKNLAVIRDIFVFCCYTGLDHGDSGAFGKDWIKEHKGEAYIDYNRAKTDFKGQVRFFAKAKELAEKYDHNFPVGSNQHHNRLLKQACYMAGISKEKAKRISTHSGRVTAGMVWLNMGIRLETVSKMLGHASIGTTRRYYADIELETMLAETRGLEWV